MCTIYVIFVTQLPEGPSSSFLDNAGPTILARRTAVPPKPSYKLNYWSIMKNCIGKDLSKIPMPVSGKFFVHTYLCTYRAIIVTAVYFLEPADRKLTI